MNEEKVLTSVWQKLKDFPWPTFLFLAMIGGGIGWWLYVKTNDSEKGAQKQTIEAQGETIRMQTKLIDYMDRKVLIDTTKK